MSDDLVTRLRERSSPYTQAFDVRGNRIKFAVYHDDYTKVVSADKDCADALEEITRLRAEVERLRGALTTEPTDDMLASACLWYRHDFGLFDEERKREWLMVAREWWRASVKEITHRAALGDDKRERQMTDLTTIVIKDVEEHEDGSATYSFDLDSNSSKKLTELGLEFVLTCAAYNMDIQEALTIISEYGRGRKGEALTSAARSEDDES